mgnify:CR=1 FL=1
MQSSALETAIGLVERDFQDRGRPFFATTKPLRYFPRSGDHKARARRAAVVQEDVRHTVRALPIEVKPNHSLEAFLLGTLAVGLGLALLAGIVLAMS